MEKQEYRIGDVADIVGLSRDALRFYEKKGVITSQKKENGYRYYSENDIYRLMYVLYQRKMNTSLEDIGGLVMEGTTPPDLRAWARQRIAEETAKMRCHQQAVTRLKLIERDLNAIENSKDVFRVKRFPKCYIMGKCGSLQEGLKEWFRLAARGAGLDMSYFYNVLNYTPEEGLVQEETQLLLYRGIEPYLDPDIDLGKCPVTEEMDCVYSVMESSRPLPDEAVYRRMAGWAESQGLRHKRRLYANDMMTFFKTDTMTYCLELYLPVETEKD